MIKSNVYLFDSESMQGGKFVDLTGLDETSLKQKRMTLSMTGASIVKIGKPIRFHLEAESDYLTALNKNAVAVFYTDEDGDNIGLKPFYGFIDSIDYENPNTCLVTYSIDPVLTYLTNTNVFDNDQSIFVERCSNPQLLQDSDKLADPLLNSTEPTDLFEQKIFKPTGDLCYLVYLNHDFSKGQSESSAVLTFTYNTYNPYTNPDGEQLADKLLNLAKKTTGEGNRELTKSVEVLLYDDFSKLLTDDFIWTENGSRIIDVEYRYLTVTQIDDLKMHINPIDASDPNLFEVPYAQNDDKQFTPYNLDSYPNYAKLKNSNYLEQTAKISGYEFKAPYASASGIDFTVRDSLLPKYRPNVSFSFGENNAGDSAFKNKYYSKLDIDRSINMVMSASDQYLYGHRNGIYLGALKIANQFKQEWYGLTQNNANEKSLASFNNTKDSALIDSNNAVDKDVINQTCKFNNQKIEENTSYQFGQLNKKQANDFKNLDVNYNANKANMQASQATALSNLQNSQKVALSNLSSSQAVSLSNLTKIAKQAEKDRLKTTYDANVENSQNSKNVASHNIDTNFVTNQVLADIGVVLAGPIAGAFTTLMNSLLTGAVNDAKAKAVLDTSYNGTGASDPAGLFKRMARSKQASDDNIDIANKASADQMQASQKVASDNLSASQKVASDNLSASQATELANLKRSNDAQSRAFINSHEVEKSALSTSQVIAENSNSFSKNISSYSNTASAKKAHSSLDTSYAKQTNSINQNFSVHKNTFMYNLQKAIENYLESIKATLLDKQYESFKVSEGNGLETQADKEMYVFINTYRQAEAIAKQNEGLLKKYGFFINNFRNADELFEDEAIETIKDYVYVKTRDMQVYKINDIGVPAVAQQAISDRLNQGIWLKRA